VSLGRIHNRVDHLWLQRQEEVSLGRIHNRVAKFFQPGFLENQGNLGKVTRILQPYS
jgi:hypothetical protein